MIIDSHHHFWRYSSAEYGWISDSMTALRRDFLPSDLAAETASAGVDGVVSVQARTTLEETRWLLEIAGENPLVCGVVGWVPLASPEVASVLEQLSPCPAFKGVREVLQGRPPGSLLDRSLNNGVSRLAEFGLVFDILIFENQLTEAAAFVDLHPGQQFVLDHIAKPCIREGGLEPWASSLRALAARPNVCCKISGMVTESDWTTWRVADLRPYFEVVLESFTPRRLMFGSDWPVCLTASSYGLWKRTAEELCEGLAADEKERIFAGTATEIYHITQP